MTSPKTAPWKRALTVTLLAGVVMGCVWCFSPPGPLDWLQVALPAWNPGAFPPQATWSPDEIHRLSWGLGIDVVGIFLYPWAFSLWFQCLASRCAQDDLQGRSLWAGLGNAVWLAVPADLLENFGLCMLSRFPDWRTAVVSQGITLSSLAKWSVVLGSTFNLLVGAVLLWRTSRKAR